MERSATWGAICLDFACHTVLESAATDEQACVLAGVEWIPTLKRGSRHARAGPSFEAIRLVVIARTIAVKRSERARPLLLLQEGHVSRNTPCRCPAGTPSGF